MKSLSLVLLGFVALVDASGFWGKPYEMKSPASINVYACTSQVTGAATFCKGTSAACVCENENALGMMAACFIMGSSDTSAAISQFVYSCAMDNDVIVTVGAYNKALTNYEQNAVVSSNASLYISEGIMTRPIVLDQNMTMLFQKAAQNLMDNYNKSLYYSILLLGYWILVGLLYALNSWCKFLFPGFFVRSKSSRLLTFMKKHFVLPAAFGSSKQAEVSIKGPFAGFFKILMPSRLESLVLVGFAVICFIFMSMKIEYVENDPIFLTKTRAVTKYLAVRTGVVSTMNVPLLVLFAGRNNFLQWLTGINFATYMTFHKWIARVLVLMIAIHSICYTILFSPSELLSLRYKYYIFGIIGTSSSCFIFFQSLLALRRKWYDLFLVVHIVLVVLFMVGASVHVYKLGYLWFMYVACAIWAFERVVRVCRMFVFGFPMADLELINGDTIRLQVPTPKWWRPTKGGFGYVYFIGSMKFFQSHPFSYVQLPNQINFYIKVKGGVTRGIQDQLSKSLGLTKKIRVSVEGPYSGGLESCNIKHYDTSVFFAGGNGIPSMFSEAFQMRGTNRKVKLIWVIRDYTFLNWFYDELMMLRDTSIEMDVYVTRPESELHGHITNLEETDLMSISSSDSTINSYYNEFDKCSNYDFGHDGHIERVHYNLRHINFFHGRPSIKAVIRTEIRDGPGNSIAFVTCGQPMMVDEMRSEITKTVDCGKRVDFYEHLQVWA